MMKVWHVFVGYFKRKFMYMKFKLYNLKKCERKYPTHLNTERFFNTSHFKNYK